MSLVIIIDMPVHQESTEKPGKGPLSYPTAAQKSIRYRKLASAASSMVLSYKRPQLDVQEPYQMKHALSSGACGTPGFVIGNPPQRGRLRLNVLQKPYIVKTLEPASGDLIHQFWPLGFRPTYPACLR